MECKRNDRKEHTAGGIHGRSMWMEPEITVGDTALHFSQATMKLTMGRAQEVVLHDKEYHIKCREWI